MIYMMMLPRRNEFNLLDDIFGDLNYAENKIMKTDIKEHKDKYSIMIDLPGYNKPCSTWDLLLWLFDT